MTDFQERAADFAARLSDLYRDSVRAIVLYGSAARGDFREGSSDINLLVILDRLDLAALRVAAPLVADWTAGGNPPPLMLSRSEWEASADVFPIEYSDIREAHVVLAGGDPFGEMRIRRDHLRLQLEHELRSKKIQLREGYLAAGESPERLAELLLAALPTFLALFRAMLRLQGAPVPQTRRELIAAVAAMADFPPDALLDVLRQRDGADRAPIAVDGGVASGYLAAIERCADWLDRFQPREALGVEV